MKHIFTLLLFGIGLVFVPAYASANNKTQAIYYYDIVGNLETLGLDFADRLTIGKSLEEMTHEILDGLPPGTAIATMAKGPSGLHFLVGNAHSNWTFYLHNNAGKIEMKPLTVGFEVYFFAVVSLEDATHTMTAVVPSRLLERGVTEAEIVLLLQPAQKLLEDFAEGR